MVAPVHPLARSLSRAPTAAPKPAARAKPQSATIWGKVLAIAILTLAASAFPDIRPKGFGFLIHPVSLAGAVLFLAGVLSIGRIPGRITLTVALFLIAFGVACFAGPGSGLSLFAKLLSSVVLGYACALFVRNEADFRWAAFAMAIALAIISMRGVSGLENSGRHGVNPLGGIANRNAFSLYALPAILISGFTALRSQTPRWMRVAFVFTGLLTVFTIFSTGNRSGWGGVILVAAMLGLPAVRKRGAAITLIGLTITAVVLVIEYGNIEVIQSRFDDTSANSPETRLHFIASAFEVFGNSPLIGASPQGLPRAMARLGSVADDDYDSHNVSALIFGGTGILGVLTLMLLSLALGLRPRVRASPVSSERAEVHYILRSAMVLWFLRGQFTAEVLYSPSLSIALGLAVGLCMLYGVWSKPQRPKAPAVRRTLRYTPVPPPAAEVPQL